MQQLEALLNVAVNASAKSSPAHCESDLTISAIDRATFAHLPSNQFASHLEICYKRVTIIVVCTKRFQFPAGELRRMVPFLSVRWNDKLVE